MVHEKKDRLALDVIGQLEEDIERNPLDYAAWSKLLDQALIKDKEEQVRLAFDKYLSIFKLDVCIPRTVIGTLLTAGQAMEQLHQL